MTTLLRKSWKVKGFERFLKHENIFVNFYFVVKCFFRIRIWITSGTFAKSSFLLFILNTPHVKICFKIYKTLTLNQRKNTCIFTTLSTEYFLQFFYANSVKFCCSESWSSSLITMIRMHADFRRDDIWWQHHYSSLG